MPSFLNETKSILEQNGFNVVQSGGLLIVNNEEITIEENIIKLNGNTVDDIQTLVEILSN